MTTTEAQPVAVPSLHKVKMEERKRSLAVDADDSLPSRKRLLKDENGQAMRMDPEKEKDVENYQKDAIMRQMKEYKRQKKDFEDQYNELSKKTQFHNDHLRTLDGWFAQLLDEVRLLAADSFPAPPLEKPSAGQPLYGAKGSALLFEDSEIFTEHLQARSKDIKIAISALFGRMSSATPEMEDLRKQLNSLLAKEKEHIVQLRAAEDQHGSLNHRLESACIRYMTAEKKLDRVKSAQVQKLEKQATMGGNGEAASNKKSATPKREHEDTNGTVENGVASAEAEAARNEAVAAAEKRKAQLAEVEAENDRLTNELSAARTKLVSLTDDDYAATSLFRVFKSQYDDIIKRVNDLEATNVQLREEAQKLQAERAAYRNQVEEENRVMIMETETQLAKAETDLARIRSLRDDANGNVARLEAAEASRGTSHDQIKELADARQQRITALESEVERLKLDLGEMKAAPSSNYDDLDANALKEKLVAVESQYGMLGKELSSMEAAWKKAQTLASRKIDEISGWEEQVSRLSAEKTKADQKYFATMKVKDAREAEYRALKQQNARANEVIANLKSTNATTTELVVNLEHQVSESKTNLTTLEQQHRLLDQKSKEAILATEGLRKQIEELKASTITKDKEVLVATKARRTAEVDLEANKSRLEDTKKQYDALRKSKAAESDNDTNDGWRKLAICPVCNTKIRNTALKLCGHVFCHDCVKDLISNRSRKCPSCGKAFGGQDHLPIVLA